MLEFLVYGHNLMSKRLRISNFQSPELQLILKQIYLCSKFGVVYYHFICFCSLTKTLIFKNCRRNQTEPYHELNGGMEMFGKIEGIFRIKIESQSSALPCCHSRTGEKRGSTLLQNVVSQSLIQGRNRPQCNAHGIQCTQLRKKLSTDVLFGLDMVLQVRFGG